jgi:hypothetical protein
MISNLGSAGDLMLSNAVQLHSVPYKVFEYLQPRDENLNLRFDGVTCDDGHMTVRLDRNKTDISFTTEFPEENGEATVQFWFKLGDKKYYSPKEIYNVYDVNILDMRFNKTAYLQVFLRDKHIALGGGLFNSTRHLLIAPFGRSAIQDDDQVLVFSQLLSKNEDEFGWWHLSCSYRESEVECTLHNTLIHEVQSMTFENEKMPKGVYQSRLFNFIDQFYVKEFRFWSDYQTNTQLVRSRYSTYPEDSANLLLSTSFEEQANLLEPDFVIDTRVEFIPATK